MSALLVARVSVKDAEKFSQYAERAKNISVCFGAETIYRANADQFLSGPDDHDFVMIMRFPTIAKLNAWHESCAYQQLKALRDDGADIQMTSYDLSA